MQIRLLGPVAVDVDGTLVEMTRPMEAAVMATLASNPRRRVSRERLIDVLWGEAPPPTAAKSLQSHVMRVRKALRDSGAGDLIVTVDGGYRLDAPVDVVDAERFEHLVDTGRAELNRGDVTAAARTMRRAVALWHGDPLAPAAAPGLEPYRIRLDELHRQAFELYAEARLGVGEHDALVPELRDAVGRDPYRERLWSLLMLALYRSGRQADALAEAQRVRRLMLEELGVDPSPELVDLEVKILQQDPSLAARDDPAEKAGPVLPAVLDAELQRPFVGRAEELLAVGPAMDAVFSGRSGVVMISGEAGIGKTLLTSRIAWTAAGGRGMRVLYGRCDEELAVPYQPFVQALRTAAHGDDAVPVLGSYPEELATLVPELRDLDVEIGEPLSSDPDSERARLYDAVVSWLEAASAREPILLVVEDVHWASAETLLLLRHVVREVVAVPFVLVVNYRSHDVVESDTFDALLAEVARSAAGIEVALEGLPISDIAELLDAAGVDDPSSDGLSDQVFDLTGGNALYVLELAERIRAGESLPSGEPSDVPAGVRRAVAARLRSLEPATVELLEVAAVLGDEFGFETLRMAVGGRIDGPLLQAMRAGLLHELPGRALRCRFPHTLTRLGVAARLSETARARLHQRVGLALEALPDPSLAELARHFGAAIGLGEGRRALTYMVAAADEALAQHADARAADLYGEALELGPEPEGRPGILIGLGEAQRRLGRPEHRSTLDRAFDAATELRDGTLMATALLTAYRGTFSRALRVNRELVDRLALAGSFLEGDSTIRAQLLATQAVELAWDLDWRRARSLSDEAMAMARRLGDEPTLARVLALRHWTVYDSLADRLETTAELDRLARLLRDPALGAEAAGMAAFTFTRRGDAVEADRRLDEARRLVAVLDRPPERWMLLIREFAAALRTGHYEAAERLATESRALGRETGQPDADLQFGVQQFWIAFDRQKPDEGVAMMHHLVADLERSWPLGWPSYAHRCAELGLDDAARGIVTAFDDRGLIDGLPRDQIWTFNLCQLAAVAAALGDGDLASRVLPQLEPVADEHANSVFVSIGSIARYLGLAAATLGDQGRAEAWLVEAVDANRHVPAWKARTLLDLAALRRAVGDGDHAALVAEAGTIAGELGLPVVSQRATMF